MYFQPLAETDIQATHFSLDENERIHNIYLYFHMTDKYTRNFLGLRQDLDKVFLPAYRHTNIFNKLLDSRLLKVDTIERVMRSVLFL